MPVLTVTPLYLGFDYGDGLPTYRAVMAYIAYSGYSGAEFLITGFEPGDDASMISGLVHYLYDHTALYGAGTSTALNVDVSGLSAPGYTFAAGSTSSIAVGHRKLFVVADAVTRDYGAANPTFTFTYENFAYGEGAGLITGTPVLTTSATPMSDATTYFITYSITVDISGLSAINYIFEGVVGILTIAKKALTVTADPQTRIYGAANPVFTHQVTGFVNGDTSAVITGTPDLSTPATTASPVTTYSIDVDTAPMSADNYSFDGTVGVLTVTLRPLIITSYVFSNQGSAPSLTPTYIGFVNGDTEWTAISGYPGLTTFADAGSPAGGYPITVDLTGASSDNYQLTAQTGLLTVLSLIHTDRVNTARTCLGQVIISPETTRKGKVLRSAARTAYLTELQNHPSLTPDAYHRPPNPAYWNDPDERLNNPPLIATFDLVSAFGVGDPARLRANRYRWNDVIVGLGQVSGNLNTTVRHYRNPAATGAPGDPAEYWQDQDTFNTSPDLNRPAAGAIFQHNRAGDYAVKYNLGAFNAQTTASSFINRPNLSAGHIVLVTRTGTLCRLSLGFTLNTFDVYRSTDRGATWTLITTLTIPAGWLGPNNGAGAGSGSGVHGSASSDTSDEACFAVSYRGSAMEPNAYPPPAEVMVVYPRVMAFVKTSNDGLSWSMYSNTEGSNPNDGRHGTVQMNAFTRMDVGGAQRYAWASYDATASYSPPYPAPLTYWLYTDDFGQTVQRAQFTPATAMSNPTSGAAICYGNGVYLMTWYSQRFVCSSLSSGTLHGVTAPGSVPTFSNGYFWAGPYQLSDADTYESVTGAMTVKVLVTLGAAITPGTGTPARIRYDTEGDYGSGGPYHVLPDVPVRLGTVSNGHKTGLFVTFTGNKLAKEDEWSIDCVPSGPSGTPPSSYTQPTANPDNFVVPTVAATGTYVGIRSTVLTVRVIRGGPIDPALGSLELPAQIYFVSEPDLYAGGVYTVTTGVPIVLGASGISITITGNKLLMDDAWTITCTAAPASFGQPQAAPGNGTVPVVVATGTYNYDISGGYGSGPALTVWRSTNGTSWTHYHTFLGFNNTIVNWIAPTDSPLHHELNPDGLPKSHGKMRLWGPDTNFSSWG